MRQSSSVAPVLLGDVEKRPHLRDAGIVEDRVEPAERTHRGLDHRDVASPVANVDAEWLGSTARGLDRPRGLAGEAVLDVGDDHAGTFAGQRLGHLGADPTTAAGDDDTLPFEPAGHAHASP